MFPEHVDIRLDETPKLIYVTVDETEYVFNVNIVDRWLELKKFPE